MGRDFRRTWSRKGVLGLGCSGLVLLGGMAACGVGEGSSAEAADTLTRRQKDSIISTLPVPGAGAVGKALKAADSASARAQRHDSLIK